MATVKKAANPQKAIDPYEMVTIKLAIDRQDRGPVFVAQGDFREEIPRGKEVQVPYYIAKLLEETEAQDEQTFLLMNQLTEHYEKEMDKATGGAGA
jgi:hypothetical protein